jgi:hypothetical protein
MRARRARFFPAQKRKTDICVEAISIAAPVEDRAENQPRKKKEGNNVFNTRV